MVEWLIMLLLLCWSTFVVFKKVFPQLTQKLFQVFSVQCEKLGWSKLANWLKPKQSIGCAGGCGCAADEEKQTQAQTVKWR